MSEESPRPELLDDAQRRFPVPDYDEVPEDIRERLDEETERAGFTPNVMSALAYKPSHFRAFMAFHDALVDDTTLDREEVEMIVVAVSGRNNCLYCNVAHGALVRIYAEDPHLADQLVSNHRTADVSDERMAMLEVAVKLTEEPDAVTTDDLDLLYEAGYTQEEVWDIGMVAAFFNLSNRMATFADWRPNEEFYGMGR
ncbi:peroxidase-related enzyme [Halobaculum magnesiiphilum]|uniref:peroxidase-related enzyme n=1 Tax=Halobaculum magnesiiphilum TaxID=1017351 RepID=UPI0031F306EF